MIELNSDLLYEKLTEIIDDSNVVDILVEVAGETASTFEGDPVTEFSGEVNARVKKEYPDFKWPGGGSTAKKAPKIFLDCLEIESSEESPIDPDMILVKYHRNIKRYGGRYYDREQGCYIREGVPVKRTKFVMAKIGEGSLIEVKG